LGDHPDAGLRALRSAHHATDVVGVDRDGRGGGALRRLRLRAHRREARGERSDADRGRGRIKNLIEAHIHPPLAIPGLAARCRSDLIPNRIRRKAEPADEKPHRPTWEAGMRSALRTVAVVAILGSILAVAPHSTGAQSYPTR